MKIDLSVKQLRTIKIAPLKLIILSFAAVILLGTFLLCLPVSTQTREPTAFVDALFTATSATCITGLVTVGTATHWSLFGQIIILSLIQIGALGIITLTTFFSVILGRKLGIRNKILAQESVNSDSSVEISHLIKRVMQITFGCEAIGAIILSLRFIPKFGWGDGIYKGIFHSVSAFCNAGFDLFGTPDNEFQSLTGFYNDPIVLYTIMGLIIIGGLGFLVWSNLINFRKTKKISTQTKMTIFVTLSLIIGGSILMFIIEHNNSATIGSMTLGQKINNSIFLSVSPRTCGYNSVDLVALEDSSKALSIFLMFIGAAPGSTGGGVKVTTLGIIAAMVICYIKGYDKTIVFKRMISPAAVKKAITIVVLALCLICVVTALIVAIDKTNLIDTVFETTSAFGTVGLTAGMTPTLHPVSKIALIITMFLGRVGPATFAVAVMMRPIRKKDAIYPEAKISVG